MAGVTTQGLGSGLDIKTIVSNLVTAEQTPIKNRLDTQEATVQAKLSTLGIVKSSISDFQTAVKALTSLNTLQSKTASVGDQSLFSATVSSAAQVGQHSITVNQLASAQKMVSTGLSSVAAQNVGTGTLHITYGDSSKAAKDIVIVANQSSLQGIRDAVNAAGAGIEASIVNDGSTAGYHLVFSTQSGAKNSVSVSGTDGLATKLNMTQRQEGKDAQVNIDGIDIVRSTNSVSDVLTGVTLDLKGVSSSSNPTSLNVNDDTSSISSAVNNFVNNYNALKGVLTKVTQYDAAKKTGSIFTGDATMRSLNTQMQRVMGGLVSGLNGNVKGLADIGVTTARDGTLALDAIKLNSAVTTNVAALTGLFATTGTATDSLVSYSKATAATKVGSYPINITQAATQGKYVASAPRVTIGQASDSRLEYVSGSGDDTVVPGNYAVHISQYATQAKASYTPGSFSISSSADTVQRSFKIKVDGKESNDIVLPAQDYGTGSALAAALQAEINLDPKLTNAQRQVSVSYNNNKLEISSNAYGSQSAIEITTVGDALGVLGFNTDLAVSGKDVAGTIGGVAATGDGKLLTGTGKASGVQVRVPNTLNATANATNGDDLGSIDFTAIAFSPTYQYPIGTQGTYTSGSLTGPFAITSSNNSFKINVDGVLSNTINLTPATNLSGTDLAAKLQEAINSDSNLAAHPVAVSFVSGALSIKSQSYGSASSIQLSSVAGTGLGLADMPTASSGSDTTSVNITHTATQAISSAAINATDNNGSFNIGSNSFNIAVDGKTSNLITLASQTNVTGVQFAQLMQDKINADSILSNAGKHVTVTFSESDKKLKFASDTYGTSSTIQISNGSNNGIDLGNPSSEQLGTDVAGTITVGANSPETAHGSGKFLTLGTQAIHTTNIGSGSFNITSGNKGFKINVDGILSNAINLTEGTYTGSQLRAELEAKINADSNLSSHQVDVSFASDNLSINSRSYGGASSIQITNVSGGGFGLAAMSTPDTGTETFRVEVSGSVTGSAIFATSTDPSTFKIKVGGIQSGQISLTNPRGGIVNNAFATRMEELINNDSALKAAGRSIQVGIDSVTKQLVITPSSYGSSSNIEISELSKGAVTLGLRIKAGDTGLDVAGTIGGDVATGSGTKLTSTAGNSTGLQIDVTGVQTGDRGSVSYTQGIAFQLNSILNGFLGTDGAIAQQVNGLNTQEATITKQRADLTTHLTKYQTAMTAKFNAMDRIVGQLRATSDALTGQLATLPFTANNSK